MKKKKLLTEEEVYEMIGRIKSKAYHTALGMGLCSDKEGSIDRNYHDFMLMLEIYLREELERNGIYEGRNDSGDDGGNNSGNSGDFQLLPVLLGTFIGTIIGNLLFFLARIIGIL